MSYRTRRIVTVVVGAAVVAMAAGCESTGNQAPSTTPTTTTSTTPSTTPSPGAPPTEKNINPTGGNLFTPQVIAPPAPTEPPGVHRKH